MLKFPLRPQFLTWPLHRCCMEFSSGSTFKREQLKKRKDPKNDNVQIFMDLFDWEYFDAYKYMKKHTKLRDYNPAEVKKNIGTLRKWNIPDEDIIAKPEFLTFPSNGLRNRGEILLECGFEEVNIKHLKIYLLIMKKEIEYLKKVKVLDESIDLKKRLADLLGIESTIDLSERLPLSQFRMELITEYFVKRLEFTEPELEDSMKKYGKRLVHKSIASITEMVEILQKDLNLSNEKIKSNGFVLHADPQNVRKMMSIDIKSYMGTDMREILAKTPKIMMGAPGLVEENIENIKAFGVPGSSLIQGADVLTLSKDTVLQRLQDIRTTDQFNGLLDNPRILKLVHHQRKAKERLHMLQEQNFKNSSINVLAGDEKTFQRHLREGGDKTKGNEICVFISQKCSKTPKEVRTYISRHPHWSCVPVKIVKENYDYIAKLGFRPETIFEQVFVLIYPPEKVRKTLESVRNNPECADATPTILLSLTLYEMEKEFHFSGDGVWPDQPQNKNFDGADAPEPPEALKVIEEEKVKQ